MGAMSKDTYVRFSMSKPAFTRIASLVIRGNADAYSNLRYETDTRCPQSTSNASMMSPSA